MLDGNTDTRTPDIQVPNRHRMAIEDIVGAARYYWLWSRLSLNDIQLRYRGSMLGPLWLTISTAFISVVMGLLYSALFKTNVPDYLPFVTTGLITWSLISGIVNDACMTFTGAQSIIQQTKLPYFTHVYRLIFRNILIFGHNAIILPIMYIAYPPTSWAQMFWEIPALIIVSINGMWISCSLGILGARFRDLPPIVSNLFQALFFITPVFWAPEMLGRYINIARYNPLTAFVDILRAPLLGKAPLSISWWVVLGVTFGGCTMTYFLLVRFRGRIAYWV